MMKFIDNCLSALPIVVIFDILIFRLMVSGIWVVITVYHHRRTVLDNAGVIILNFNLIEPKSVSIILFNFSLRFSFTLCQIA